MRTEKINVKDKSVGAFLSANLLNKILEDRHGINTSFYHLMTDEIFLKKDCGLEIDEQIQFELIDSSNGSRQELINVYIYSVQKYDDVAVKLKLTHFRIEHKADPIKL